MYKLVVAVLQILELPFLSRNEPWENNFLYLKAQPPEFSYEYEAWKRVFYAKAN